MEHFSSIAFRIKFVIPYRIEQLDISCLDALLYGTAVDKGMDRKQRVFSGITELVKRKLASNTSAASVELMLEASKTVRAIPPHCSLSHLTSEKENKAIHNSFILLSLGRGYLYLSYY